MITKINIHQIPGQNSMSFCPGEAINHLIGSIATVRLPIVALFVPFGNVPPG